MTYSQSIRINNRLLTPGQKIEDTRSHEYEAEIAQFIDSWLSGTKTFELKTSGSTGSPKTITVKREYMQASASATINYLGIKPGTPVTVCIDARYIGGKMQLVRALSHNLPIQLFSPQSNISSLLESLENPGLLSLVPLQLYELLPGSLHQLNKATAVLVGGATIDETALTHLQTLKTPVYHTYGMTETVSHIALRLLSGPHPPKHFTALPGISITTDERSCLIINGAVTGFTNVVSNDVVEQTGPSSFVWKGRSDNVVNSGGVKLHPEQIDQRIAPLMQEAFPGKSFFTSGMPDAKLGQKLVLCIEATPPPTTAKLMGSLKAALPAYHAPKDIIFADNFKRTPSGKVDRAGTLASASR